MASMGMNSRLLNWCYYSYDNLVGIGIYLIMTQKRILSFKILIMGG